MFLLLMESGFFGFWVFLNLLDFTRREVFMHFFSESKIQVSIKYLSELRWFN
jgi:hypothetical protein